MVGRCRLVDHNITHAVGCQDAELTRDVVRRRIRRHLNVDCFENGVALDKAERLGRDAGQVAAQELFTVHGLGVHGLARDIVV